MSKDDAEKRLARAARLMEKARELHAMQWEVLEELRKIVAGEQAIGDLLRRISDFYVAAWEGRYGSKYLWQGAKDAASAKRLLKVFTPEEIEARIILWIKDGDQFYVKARHPFTLFAANTNRYAPDTASRLLDLVAAPVGCQHVPPCESDQIHTRRRMADMRGGA